MEDVYAIIKCEGQTPTRIQHWLKTATRMYENLHSNEVNVYMTGPHFHIA